MSSRNKTTHLRIVTFVVYVFLAFFFVVSIFPFVWMTGASLKTNAEIFSSTSLFPTQTGLRFENYHKAWTYGSFGRYFLNSVIVVFITTVIVCFSASLSGYAFSKFTFPGRTFLFLLFLGMLMIPAHVTIVTLFHQLRHLKMLNTHQGLIFSYSSRFMPFAIFLMKGFYDTTPSELIDAAIIDGTSQFAAFIWIMMPLSKPVIVTAAIVTIMNSWQEFVYATTFISSKDMMTIPVGLTMFQGEHVTEWSSLFAGTGIATFPIIVVFLLLQRYYLQGLFSGALKS